MVNVVGVLGMAAAHSFVPLLLGRLVTGIGIGAAVPAIRRIVILADPERHRPEPRPAAGDRRRRLRLRAGDRRRARRPVRHRRAVPRDRRADGLRRAASCGRTKIEETPDDQVPTQRLAFDLLRYRPFLGAVVLGSVVFVMIGAVRLVVGRRPRRPRHAATGWPTSASRLFALPLIVLGAVRWPAGAALRPVPPGDDRPARRGRRS